MDGGFRIEKELNASNLYELSKMDGAIILNSKATRIHCASVHLNPDPGIISHETGIRHRTAERSARQTGCPVISVSQRRNVITLYMGEEKYVLNDLSILLGKVNQALQTLERHKNVLDQSLINLSALEFENLVTLEEVTMVLQRSEVVLRIAEIVEQYVVELGDEGNLIVMQLAELLGNPTEDQRLLVMDYCVECKESAKKVLQQLEKSSSEELKDLSYIGKLLGYEDPDLELPLRPRGYRVLHKIPRLPQGVIDNVVQTLGGLADIMASPPEKLGTVEGIGEVRARSISRGLKRLREQCLIERHI
jgi:diadenylate cyclase